MAFHADGSLVTTEQSSGAGEDRPTAAAPSDLALLRRRCWRRGFFPPNPPQAVSDSVVLSVGGTNPTATSTAAPGFTGVVSMQFQVSAERTSKRHIRFGTGYNQRHRQQYCDAADSGKGR